jgi:type IV pilus assembly protein PilC
MLYKYIATTSEGEKHSGAIEAANIEIAIKSLQARNLIIVSINPAEKKDFFWRNIKFFERISKRDIVILSRQLAILFEAKVPALVSFKLLAGEAQNPALRSKLAEVIDDIQGGISLSQAMTKHPDVFSRFYISMVRSGEESGKLEESFSFLADYLERSYELSAKARNALIYPAFIFSTLVTVLILMLVFVIPRLTTILQEAGQEIPLYTKIIIGLSNFFREFGIFLLIALIAAIVFLWRYSRTEKGKLAISRFQLSFPFVGSLYKKFYLSRITDNLETSISSGISAVRALEIASDVVGNNVYSKILLDSVKEIKGGCSLSKIFSQYEEIPKIVSQMIKIGEESGKLNFILKTLGRFYKREVDNSVDVIVSLIEPVMIVIVGIAVGLFIVSIIGPIYSITAGV